MPPPASASPSAWVRRFAGLIRPGGRVLDLAAGNGRHTRFLLKSGFAVVAVDRDDAVLAPLAAEPRCEIVALDLEDGAPWRLGGEFDGIVVAWYLHRPLLASLAEALAPAGVLIYETFLVGNERFGKPRNPAFLLRENELFDTYRDRLAIVAFEQGIATTPRPGAFQRIAAVKRPVAAQP